MTSITIAPTLRFSSATQMVLRSRVSVACACVRAKPFELIPGVSQAENCCRGVCKADKRESLIRATSILEGYLT